MTDRLRLPLSPKRRARPEDPICSLHDCWYGDEEMEPGISLKVGHDGRIAMQRRYADEFGIPLAAVSCLRRYARPRTRQDAWDDVGADEYGDRLAMKHKIGWYIRPETPQGEKLTPGWYFDRDGTTPAPQWMIDEVDGDPPAEPPADWEPPEHAYGYDLVDRAHPDAVPVLICMHA